MNNLRHIKAKVQSTTREACSIRIPTRVTKAVVLQSAAEVASKEPLGLSLTQERKGRECLSSGARCNTKRVITPRTEQNGGPRLLRVGESEPR